MTETTGQRIVPADPAGLVHRCSEAAFAVDGEGRILGWNGAAEDLLGFSPPEVVGTRCDAVLRAFLPDGQRLCSQHCDARRCFLRGEPFRSESCLARRKDGSLARLQIGSFTLPGCRRSGDPIAVVFLRPLDRGRSEGDAAHARLEVRTLGRFALFAGGRALPHARWPRKQALTLLKYLVTLRGRPVHRERLIECLWPDVGERQGRQRLKVTVYFLRRELRRAGLDGDVLETAGESYLLMPERLRVDADLFEERVGRGRRLAAGGRGSEARALYEEAAELYRGDYLEEDLYADWGAEERERLREVYLDALGQLADLCATGGDHMAAVHVCRKALAQEPCRESFHRTLMRSLLLLGRRDEAIAQYRACQTLLRSKLGVEPMRDTRALFERILRWEEPVPAAAGLHRLAR